jgi:flagellar hook-basal body complex protein FliE
MRISENSIDPIVSRTAGNRSLGRTEATETTSFAATLGNALESVNNKNQEANVAVSNMLNGTGEVHDAMIALHEAEEAIEITVAIRNKFVQAYQDIMRMPL